jgi:DNA-binding NtrC family response regulator
MGRTVTSLSAEDCRALRAYSWPGNVRELRNVVERALITSPEGRLRLSALPDDRAARGGETAGPGDAPRASEGAPSPSSTPSADETPPTELLREDQLRDLERRNMIAALEYCGWRVSGEDGAAALLGIPPSTFKSRMKTMGITRT